VKVSRDFDIRELVPPSIWERFGQKSVWFVRPGVIELAQFYREFFDSPVRINDWHYGGDLTMRGFRPPSSGVGAELSQHRFGNAFDCDIEGLTADEVREAILKHESAFMEAGLTTLESGAYAPTWVHSDLRTTNKDQITMVAP